MTNLKNVLLVIFIVVLSVQSREISSRIVHGNEAVPFSSPWQCGLLVSLLAFPGLTSVCGGSVLSSNIVLTSAFCLQDSESALVIAGAHRMFEFESTQQRAFVTSEHYIVHPDYRRESMANDIALLRLKEPFKFNEFVRNIELPPERLLTFDFVGEDTQITGWGRFSDWTGSASDVLRVTRNFVIESEYCASYFGQLVSNVSMCLESHLSRSSTCRGDHGSAVTWREDERAEQIVIGTVSFGAWLFNLGCDPQQNNYVPTVNTRITHFVPWINQKIKENEINY